MPHHSLVLPAAAFVLSLTTLAAQPPAQGAQPPQGQAAAQGRGARQGMPRDRVERPQGTSSISGRVLAADSGRPIKRARISVAGTAAAGGRGGTTAVTDDQGRYSVSTLAAGNYTVSASKSGFVDAIYGQRRPLQPGIPVQLGDAQAIANIDLRLTRGGVITGRIADEDGEPLARALVTVQRYSYQGGQRQLQPVGGDVETFRIVRPHSVRRARRLDQRALLLDVSHCFRQPRLVIVYDTGAAGEARLCRHLCGEPGVAPADHEHALAEFDARHRYRERFAERRFAEEPHPFVI